MPTGYTAGIADGSIKTFKEYALQCARAFGATIDLRDEPLSAEIPEFAPSSYHQDQAESARAELEQLRSMTAKEIEQACLEYNRENLDTWKRQCHEMEEKLARYKYFHREALAFTPPTEEHVEYSNFLVTQIEESIKWDTRKPKKPEEKLPSEWHSEKIERCKGNIEYHVIKHEEEKERVTNRNQWVEDLRTALNN